MKKILLEALLGFVLWTVFLTPYMVLVVQVDLNQYLWWLLMQAILIPILAPIVFRITKYIENKHL